MFNISNIYPETNAFQDVGWDTQTGKLDEMLKDKQMEKIWQPSQVYERQERIHTR